MDIEENIKTPAITCRLTRGDKFVDLFPDSLRELTDMLPAAWPMLFPEEEEQRYKDMIESLKRMIKED